MYGKFKVLIGENDESARAAAAKLKAHGLLPHCVSSEPVEVQFEAMSGGYDAVVLYGETSCNEMICSNLGMSGEKPLLIMVCREEYFSGSADVCVRAPVDGEILYRIIENSSLKVSNVSESLENRVHREITHILSALCVTPSYKGFNYLREAIKMAVFDEQNTRYIYKEVYTSIARLMNTTPAAVERGMRTAIDKGWEMAIDYNKILVFGTYAISQGWRPTNSDFIYIIADKILCEIKDHDIGRTLR